jgi:hypothetical protein
MSLPTSPSRARPSAPFAAGSSSQADASGASPAEAQPPEELHQLPKRRRVSAQPEHAGSASTVCALRRASLPPLALDEIECTDISGVARGKQIFNLSNEPTTPELEKKVKVVRPTETEVNWRKVFFSIETEAMRYSDEKGDLPEEDKHRKTTLLLRNECIAALNRLGYGIRMVMAVREKICDIEVKRNADTASVATNVKLPIIHATRLSSLVNDVIQVYIEAIRPQNCDVITHQEIVSEVRRQTSLTNYKIKPTRASVWLPKTSPLKSYVAQFSKSKLACGLLFDSIEAVSKAELVFSGEALLEPEGGRSNSVSSFLRRRYDAAKYFLEAEGEVSVLLRMIEGIKYIPAAKINSAHGFELTGELICNNEIALALISPLVCQFAKTELDFKDCDHNLLVKKGHLIDLEVNRKIMGSRKELIEMGFETQLASAIVSFLSKLCFLSKYNHPVFDVMMKIMGLASKDTFDQLVAKSSNPQKMVEIIETLDEMYILQSDIFAKYVLFQVKEAFSWPSQPGIRYLRDYAVDQQNKLGARDEVAVEPSPERCLFQHEDHQPLTASLSGHMAAVYCVVDAEQTRAEAAVNVPEPFSDAPYQPHASVMPLENTDEIELDRELNDFIDKMLKES